jgi:hypothetical protein
LRHYFRVADHSAGTRKYWLQTASISRMACWQQLTEDVRGNARLSSCEELFQPLAAVHSSRSSVKGSTDKARRAGIHVASSPSSAIVKTTPANTSGSRGVA